MAHSLALRDIQFLQVPQPPLCSNPSHAHGYPHLCALQLVIINCNGSISFTLLIFNEMFVVKKKGSLALTGAYVTVR
jgi:hypothetical protein